MIATRLLIRCSLAIAALGAAACSESAGPWSVGDVEPALVVAPPDSTTGFLGAGQIAGLGEQGVAVVDQFSGRLIRFDGRGRAVSVVGGSGQGPGEFMSPMGLFPTAQGVGVFDAGLGRITLFGPDGGLAGSFRSPLTFSPVSVPFGPNGLVLLDVFSRSGARGPEPSVVWTSDVTAAGGPDWQRVDLQELAAAVPDAPEPSDGLVVGSGQAGRVYWGWGEGDYRIVAQDPPTRAVLFDVHRSLERPERDAEELQERQDRYRQLRQMGARGANPTDDLALHPHFAQFLEDDCGRLWVRTYRGGRDAAVVDVFAPDGAFLGELRFTGHIRQMAHPTENVVHAIVQLEYGERGVATYSVPQPARCRTDPAS